MSDGEEGGGVRGDIQGYCWGRGEGALTQPYAQL